MSQLEQALAEQTLQNEILRSSTRDWSRLSLTRRYRTKIFSPLLVPVLYPFPLR